MAPLVLIKSLKINNLRNIKSIDLETNPGLNLLVGENGAGKTSVLESLVMLAKGRSFRTGSAEALIGPQAESFTVSASVRHGEGREHMLGIERSRGQWKARRDGKDVRQLGELAADLPLVLMEPNSHLLISGPPDGRRRYLDWGVFHVEHGFLATWRRYARALKQRNAALRARDANLVKSLDPLVTDLGEQIDEQRQTVADRLVPIVKGQVARLSPELPDMECKYRRGWTGESLREALQAAMERDMDRGATGPGPHRADLSITVGGNAAREILSRGEQKAMAAALLLGQAWLMSEAGEVPVLLLDDLASELDGQHRDNVLAEVMQTGAQVWVTGTSSEPYLGLAPDNHRMFHVEHGKITTETKI